MSDWMYRKNAPFPFQTWRAFPPDAVVQIRNAYGESRVGPAGSFWWGYETELGGIGDGVVLSARRLDKPKLEGKA